MIVFPPSPPRRTSEAIGLCYASGGQAAGCRGYRVSARWGGWAVHGVFAMRGKVQEARGGCSRRGASAAQRSAQAAAAVDRAQAGSVRARARARCRTVFYITLFGGRKSPIHDSYLRSMLVDCYKTTTCSPYLCFFNPSGTGQP